MRRIPGFAIQYAARVHRHQLGCEPDELGTRPVQLGYTPADPFAVTLNVADTHRWVQWRFARELLADGVERGAGIGDVHICPAAQWCGKRVAIILRHVPGAGAGVELQLRRAEVEHFLAHIEALVPEGSEAAHIDWDREFAGLAGGEPR